MHFLTIQTKFTFGDRVRFDSRLQSCRGSGTIEVITVDRLGHIDYMIAVDGDDSIQGGILENEIELENEGKKHQ